MANSGRLNIGTAGAGTSGRVVLELFKMATGLNLTRVDYRGEAPALADLLGQHVDVIFASLPGSIEYIRANRLRSLAFGPGSSIDLLARVLAEQVRQNNGPTMVIENRRGAGAMVATEAVARATPDV